MQTWHFALTSRSLEMSEKNQLLRVSFAFHVLAMHVYTH